MEEWNVGSVNGKSPKQGLTGAKYLTIELLSSPRDASLIGLEY